MAISASFSNLSCSAGSRVERESVSRVRTGRERERESESEPVSTRLPTCLAHVNQPVVLAGPGEPVIPRLEVQDHVVVGNSEAKLANFHDLQVVFDQLFQFSNTTSVKFTDTTTLVVFPSRVRTRDVAIYPDADGSGTVFRLVFLGLGSDSDVCVRSTNQATPPAGETRPVSALAGHGEPTRDVGDAPFVPDRPPGRCLSR